jgi:hypothetical protein
MVELWRLREAAAPACADEQTEEGDAGALVRGSGEAAGRAKIAAGERVSEGPAGAAKVGHGIRGFDEVIDEWVMAEEGGSEASCGNGQRGGRMTLLDSFEDGGEMDAAAERKPVLEDKDTVWFAGEWPDTSTPNEALGGHESADREVPYGLTQRHCLAFFRASVWGWWGGLHIL